MQAIRLSLLVLVLFTACLVRANETQSKIDQLNRKAENELETPEKALATAREALKLSTEINYEKGKAASYGCLALVFIDWEQPEKAIDYLNKAMRYYHSVKNEAKVADIYNQLCRVNTQINELEKAQKYVEQAISINKKLKNNPGLASNYANLGGIFKYNYQTDSAIFYSGLSLKIYKQLNDTLAIINQLGNIGAIYGEEGMIMEETKYYEEALSLASLTGYSNTTILFNYATALLSLRKLDECEKYLNLAIEEGNQSKDYKTLSDSYTQLYRIYRDLKKNPEQSLLYLEKAKAYNDSTVTKEGIKKILRFQMQSDFEEKQRQDSLKQSEIRIKEQIQFEEKSKRTSIIIWAAILVVAILVVLAIILFRSNRQKEATNLIISQQKSEIEKKSGEIMDSILYAQKIQQAVLPKEEELRQLFPNSFIYYKPKDIVGGDFYFVTESRKEPGSVFLAVADCTGHGVPGGFMSMLGLSFLQEIIEEDEETNTGFILNRLRHKVIQSLKQSENLLQNKDGMDITLIKYNQLSKKIQWSAANHSIYFLSNHSLEEAVSKKISLIAEKNNQWLYRMKGQKQPIGYFPNMTAFETHTLSSEGLTGIFMFSDGVVDQFGGPFQKKFKHSSVENWIFDTLGLEAELKKMEIESRLTNWQGKNEQLDDICLIGVSF